MTSRSSAPAKAASASRRAGVQGVRRTWVAALQPDSLAWVIKTAADAVTAVIASGRSLTAVLAELRARNLPPEAARAQAVDLIYATLRRYGRADLEMSYLLDRPTSEDELRNLLRVALCWLEMHPDRSHVGVDQAVEAAATLSGGRYRGFVNAILRRALRERAHLDETITADLEAHYQHPHWWLKRLQHDWPEDWERIAAGGNRKPPMGLRVNRLRSSVEAVRQACADAGIALEPSQTDEVDDALLLTRPQPSETLPGFAQGWMAVQDIGAQQAARLLDVRPGMRVLDACAAPGGKASHLLEWAAIDLTAIEVDPERCKALATMLDPAKFPADRSIHLVRADVTRTDAAWAKRPFDTILLDAPCSGSGVVGRHPDAKWLRREEDIDVLAQTQARMLRALWPLLKTGGRMLYGTCSVFAQENQEQIARFVQQTPDAQCVSETHLLPDARHDGFYYALLQKGPSC